MFCSLSCCVLWLMARIVTAVLLATEPDNANVYTPLLMKCVRECVCYHGEVLFSIGWHQFVLDGVVCGHSVTVAKVACFVCVCVCVRDRDIGVNRAASRVEDAAKDSTKIKRSFISKLDFFFFCVDFVPFGRSQASCFSWGSIFMLS